MQIFFNSNDVQLYRKRRIGSSNRYAVSATLTVYQADIQPAIPEKQVIYDGDYGTVWETYMDSSIDVKEGDVLKDTATGKRYLVKGVVKWTGAGLLDHSEITLVSNDG